MGASKFLVGFLTVFFVSAVLPSLALSQQDEAATEAKSKNKAKKKKKKNKEPLPETDPYESDAQAESGEGESEPESGEAGQPEAESQPASSEGSLRRSNRMEFDERLVKGQAAKSGAVYLFKRTPRPLPGLVPMRRSYRRRIVEPVLGSRELKPAVYSSNEGAAEETEKQEAKSEPVQDAKKEEVKNAAEEEPGAKPEDLEKSQKKKKKKEKKKRGGKN